jgi:hypothetical protein
MGIAALGLAVAACSPVATASPTERPTQGPTEVTAPSEAPTPTPLPEPTATVAPALSFEPATYTDPAARFEFDYPASWVVGPNEQQSRGAITPFTSWSRPTDAFPGETPPGETRFDLTVQLWDPKGDLPAFLEQRRGAWDASGIRVVSEEDSTLSDGRPAASFVVEGSDGVRAFFFFTTAGQDYLVLSGDGNVDLLAEIARTVRPAPEVY